MLVLPDHGNSEAIPVESDYSSPGYVRFDHASGRPWVVGRLLGRRLVYARDRNTQIVVIGSSSADIGQLEQILRKMKTITDLPVLTHGIAGNFVVIASREESIIAFGPVFQTYRLFTCQVNGMPLISDRADMLASICRSRIDRSALALKLISSVPDQHLADRPMWEQIFSCPGGTYLLVDKNGCLRSAKWWNRPGARLRREEGAELLRDELARAVGARRVGFDHIACDLSGGLDSTPICYLSPTLGRTTAVTYFNDDPGGREDLSWARKAIVSMPEIEAHVVQSIDDAPQFFGGLRDMSIVFDEPSQVPLAAPRMQYTLEFDAESQIGMHLNGAGGDHLLRGVPVWNHTLARNKPLFAWRRICADPDLKAYGRCSLLRQLLNRQSYGQWLKDLASGGLKDFHHDGEAGLRVRVDSWFVPPQFPSWLTSEARELLRNSFLEAAEADCPLASDRAGHFDRLSILEAGRVVRNTQIVGDCCGVSYEAPLLDDRVVEAVLAVRYEERDGPLEWKPLMKQAMMGFLPDDYLHRTTKVGGSPQVIRGYWGNAREVMEILEDSGLFGTGLVNKEILQREAAPSMTDGPPGSIISAINIGLFLRNLHSHGLY